MNKYQACRGYDNDGNWNSGFDNCGHLNSGSWNIGNWNSGSRNIGGCNSGSWNIGHRNSGNWNSCDHETGFFNSRQDEYIRVFNKKTLKSKWDAAEKPGFIYFQIDKKLGYKESFQKAFESATDKDVELLKALPNFDSDVFYEISGIRV